MAVISVVEDSLAMAKLIELKLKSQGHEVTHYADGQLGLEGVINNPPDLMLLDVDLPYLNGFEVAQKIREHNVISELPILMLTGRSDVQSRVRGLEYVDDYVSKPFSPDELTARVKALIRRSRFNRISSQQKASTKDTETSVSASAVTSAAMNNVANNVTGTVRSVKSLKGATIGQYADLIEVGKGGMSIVYRALDTTLNRYVVLKFFTDLYDNQEMKERFTREATAAAILNHGNICSVFTIGETKEGHPFMVMPFLEGENLEECLRRGPLKFEKTINYVRQIARGLANAHKLGIVHRDVKPANIFITKQGTAKLLDFGVAQWQRNANQQRLTQPGSMVGTISYMAPEQVLGQEVDVRADVWSLGAVTFEMLSGTKPFANTGNILSTINAIVHEPIPQIEDYVPSVMPEVKRFVEKMLCKDTSGRYSTMLEILKDLDGVHATLLEQSGSSITNKQVASDYRDTHGLFDVIEQVQEIKMID